MQVLGSLWHVDATLHPWMHVCVLVVILLNHPSVICQRRSSGHVLSCASGIVFSLPCTLNGKSITTSIQDTFHIDTIFFSLTLSIVYRLFWHWKNYVSEKPLCSCLQARQLPNVMFYCLKKFMDNGWTGSKKRRLYQHVLHKCQTLIVN